MQTTNKEQNKPVLCQRVRLNTGKLLLGLVTTTPQGIILRTRTQEYVFRRDEVLEIQNTNVIFKGNAEVRP